MNNIETSKPKSIISNKEVIHMFTQCQLSSVNLSFRIENKLWTIKLHIQKKKKNKQQEFDIPVLLTSQLKANPDRVSIVKFLTER